MKHKRIVNEIEKLESVCTIDLMDELNVKVIEDSLMNDKDNDALLITGHNKSILFIKDCLPSLYKNFVLLHECGHRACHFRPDAQYSYMQNQYMGRLENEANIFACLFLLKDESLEDVNLINVLESKGVPRQIAIKFVEECKGYNTIV